MRTIYEILKEVGLEHKDAVMIDFAYSNVKDGCCGLVSVYGKSLTNDAADILSVKLGIGGATGARFWSYEAVQKALNSKFPEGAPITYSINLTAEEAEKIGECLSNYMVSSPMKCLKDASEARSVFVTAWAERKVC